MYLADKPDKHIIAQSDCASKYQVLCRLSSHPAPVQKANWSLVNGKEHFLTFYNESIESTSISKVRQFGNIDEPIEAFRVKSKYLFN